MSQRLLFAGKVSQKGQWGHRPWDWQQGGAYACATLQQSERESLARALTKPNPAEDQQMSDFVDPLEKVN